MTPGFDLLNVLKAVTPIVTTIASNSCNKPEKPIASSDKPVINITINNHFYSAPSEVALRAATMVDQQIIEGIENGSIV